MFLSRARTAIIPRPLQSEESLTSWFVRVARANAMSQHELGSVLLGKDGSWGHESRLGPVRVGAPRCSGVSVRHFVGGGQAGIITWLGEILR